MAINACTFRNGECLAHGADSCHAHKVVDQLGDVARTERAEVEYVFTLNVENRLNLIEGFFVACRHDVEQAVFRVCRCTAKRSINHACAFCGQIGTDFASGGRDGCTVIDNNRALFDTCQDAVVAVHYAFNNVGRCQAQHDNVAFLGQFFWARGFGCATCGCRSYSFWAAINDVQFKAIFLQAFSHVAAHKAKADKADDRFFHFRFLDFLIL